VSNNPFDLIDPEVIENPYPMYDLLRSASPVAYLDEHDIWLVTGFAECMTVLRNPDVFHQWEGSEMFEPGSGPALGNPDYMAPEVRAVMEEGHPNVPTLVTCNQPEHTGYRGVVNHAWSAKRTAEAMETRIYEIANELVDAFPAEGPVDLVRQFAVPLPIITIAEILGVPPGMLDTFKKWSDDSVVAIGGAVTKERMIESARSIVEFQRYFEAQVEDRRRHPRDDVLTVMAEATLPDGRRLDMAELLSILMQMLVAGNETTTSLIGSMMWQIASEPGLFDKIRNDLSLVPSMVEESLRIESPVQGLFRRTVSDFTIGEVTIPAGAKVLTLYGAANRDPERFTEPECFHAGRANVKQHLAFGYGIHFCIGAPLARREAQIALETLATRLSDLRLAPGHDIRHNQHPLLRGLQELWLEVEPVQAGIGSATAGARPPAGADAGLEVRVDPDSCMGTGNCERLAPTVFNLDNGLARVGDPGAADEEAIVQAALACPTGAITVRRDGQPLA
jgi:cytochrome P450/ferredoxin